MLSSKTKGLFAEVSQLRVIVAQTSAPKPPFVIEKISEVPLEKGAEAIKEMTLGFGGKSAKFISCDTAVYPQSRFFVRHSVDSPAKLKEAGFVEDLVRNQLNIDLNANTATILNAADGMPLDPSRPTASQKELVVCGATVQDIRASQEKVLSFGIYPERMEIGSLSVVGALSDIARSSGFKRPILLVEADMAVTRLYIVTPERVDLCKTVPVGFDSMLPVLASELGVKDEQSARSMLYSNTFDFTEVGPTLLGRMLKEIRSCTGFYEVQTGQSFGGIFIHLLPSGLEWVRACLSKALGIEPMKIELAQWLQSRGVTVAEGVPLDAHARQYLGLFGLMLDFENQPKA